MMIDSHSTFLLVSALAAVVGLVLLVALAKLNPFIALLLSSLFLAAVTRMAPLAAVHSFEAGMGGTLGHILVIVALGTMLGKMMAESGAAARIAYSLMRVFGEKRIPWAMAVIGILVGLPAFFQVGFVLLIPIVYTVARRTRSSLVLIGLPMLAGLSVVHGLVPPHPAVLLGMALYKADVGKTILYGILVSIPCALIAGPVYAKLIAPHIKLAEENPMADQFVDSASETNLPGIGIALFTILFPIVLMMTGSWADAFSATGSGLNKVLHFAGNDDMALLIGTLLSFVTLGRMRGFNRATILRFSNECLAPTASITLLVGAGGGFGRVLQDCGVAQAILAVASHSHIPLLVLAWSLAALMRIAAGSATVAMSTAAGIVAPLVMAGTNVHPELLAIATGAGSLIFSHVNDGGFWLVKEYFNMSVVDTLKTWSVCETLIAVTGLACTLGLSYLV
jgi:GntP family gluconate:H+ symporter